MYIHTQTSHAYTHTTFKHTHTHPLPPTHKHIHTHILPHPHTHLAKVELFQLRDSGHMTLLDGECVAMEMRVDEMLRAQT